MGADGAGSRPTVGAVLEGGGFRGMYTAGVLDVWMEHGLTADACVGVSAGATFGCNFKSLQVGRALRYNKRYCGDPRYVGLRNLVLTGDLFSRDFAYGELPWELDVFDSAAFAANPMRFTVVATDIVRGEAVYHDLGPGDEGDIEWIRASASIPALSRPVELDGRLDPVPLDARPGIRPHRGRPHAARGVRQGAELPHAASARHAPALSRAGRPARRQARSL